jgi:hypothetical protein
MKTINYNGHKFEVINGVYKYNGLIINSINSLSPTEFFKKNQGTKIMIQEMIAIENGKKRKIVIETVDEPVTSDFCPSPRIGPPAEHAVSRMVVDDAISSLGSLENDNKIISFSDWKDYCEYRRDTHQMASKYYQKKNKYFTIPSILLASISGTLSFFATSNSIDVSDGQKINLVVGTLAGISSLIQSFSATFKYSAKAESHQIATESFDILLNKIRFKIARGFESEIQDKEFLKIIENEIIEIKHRCKTNVPIHIEKKYIDRTFKYIRNKQLFKLKKAYIEKISEELHQTLEKDEISKFENTLEKGFDAV